MLSNIHYVPDEKRFENTFMLFIFHVRKFWKEKKLKFTVNVA